MNCVWRRVTAPILLCRNIRQSSLRTSRPYHICCKSLNNDITSTLGNLPTSSHSFIRYKSKKKHVFINVGFIKKPINSHGLTQLNQNIDVYVRYSQQHKAAENSDDEEDLDDDSSLSRDSKIVKFSTTSMRTDVILKSALGVARNKIEQIFYESKIRLNGKKILKKSVSAKIGDEIDVIKAVSAKNPDHLHVSRVEIINVTAKEDSITVTARRFKSLLIENYEIDPHKASAPADAEN